MKLFQIFSDFLSFDKLFEFANNMHTKKKHFKLSFSEYNLFKRIYYYNKKNKEKFLRQENHLTEV